MRIQWHQVIQQQLVGQPTDAHRAFYSLLLQILAHCVARKSNFSRSSASFVKLLSELYTLADWDFVKVEAIEKTAHFMAASFPVEYLLEPTEALSAFSTYVGFVGLFDSALLLN